MPSFRTKKKQIMEKKKIILFIKNTIADSQKHIFNSNNITPNMVKIDKQFMPPFIIIISWTITLITASQSDPIPSSSSQVFKMIYRLYTENTDTCRLLGQQHNRSVYHTCLMITKYNHYSGVNFFALSCLRYCCEHR